MREPPRPLPQTVSRSQYAHAIALPDGAVCVHALERTRLVVRPDVLAILDALREPQPAAEFAARFAAESGRSVETVTACIEELLARHLLFPGTPDDETARYEQLAAAMLRGDDSAREEWDAPWSQRTMDRFAAVRVARDVDSFAPLTHHASVLVVGFCDVHFASDLLRDAARRRGIELRVDAVFEMDAKAAGEAAYDFVIVGALAARHGHWYRSDGRGDLDPARYLPSARAILDELRATTAAPILLHNLPVPTLTPLGLADRGQDSPAARTRAINEGLRELANAVPGTYVVDVDAALNRAGKLATLDDRLVPTSHLGGIGWWSILPDHELRSVHGVAFTEKVNEAFAISDPLLYDRIVAGAELEWIQVLLGAGRRKCVVVDLDNTLWPGVLADTGSPFPPDLDFTLFSFHSIYLGIHQALKALKSRGILLACVSKNDEPVVRSLWRYPPSAPPELLLTPDDFVTWRVNWNEKSDNIRSIAGELNLGLDSFVFVDDHPVERDKVRRFLPEVLVLGDSMLHLRETLLTMPELQVANVTDEAKKRTEMTRAQIEREHLREQAVDPEAYRRSLGIRCTVRQLGTDDDLERVHELIVRTNQFNTTGWRLPRHELAAMLRDSSARLHVLRVADRFTDYGLVGACLERGGTIELFVMSCRVIGLGAEHALLRAAVNACDAPVLRARIVPTERNLPVRNLYREHGFVNEDGEWRLDRGAILAPLDPALTIE